MSWMVGAGCLTCLPFFLCPLEDGRDGRIEDCNLVAENCYVSLSIGREVEVESMRNSHRLETDLEVDSWMMNGDEQGLEADDVDLSHGRQGMVGIRAPDSSEDRFFDSREDLSSLSESSSDCLDDCHANDVSRFYDMISDNFRSEVWIANLDSVRERRDKFLKWLDIGSSDRSQRTCTTNRFVETDADSVRLAENTGAVLRSFDPGNGFSSSQSSFFSSSNGATDASEDGVSEENFVCRIKNLDDGNEFMIDVIGQDGSLGSIREVGSNRSYTLDEFQRLSGFSPSMQEFLRREAAKADNLGSTGKRWKKKWWFQRLGSVACVANVLEENITQPEASSSSSTKFGGQRIKVRQNKKRSKEFSALFAGQEVQAHKGSILTMKFSPDGRYLASAGEDAIVRVWRVMECERRDGDNITNVDPSCLYFVVDGSSQLASLVVEKDRSRKCDSLRMTKDSASVVLPTKLFRISESPLHEFHGHCGDILDLSWSNSQQLLSSSVDKSVRLWQVGYNQCLKVFYHCNYVTCIHFNPQDDNYFISGSIDGKVRIWDISSCVVVDWSDTRDIVTAACYHPNGKEAIIGSFHGNCRFYTVSGNHLHLDKQICLQGKKKSTTRGVRITGFQYSPIDPFKVMVTSSDSKIRILEGSEVIVKYKGLKNAESWISASFSYDGKHIISASEDSNVYVWNCSKSDGTSANHVKSIWSYERFFSSNASVAIPWSGMKCENSAPSTFCGHNTVKGSQHCSTSSGRCLYDSDSSHNTVLFSSCDHFSLRHGLCSEILPKGSATWPEEKLPSSNSLTLSFDQYKVTMKSPHAWGLTIVTAGRDGIIRSFHNYGLPVHL